MHLENKFKPGEKVKVYTLDRKGYIIGKIISYNDFREPGKEYAVDAELSDYIFVGENQLEKIKEETK